MKTAEVAQLVKDTINEACLGPSVVSATAVEKGDKVVVTVVASEDMMASLTLNEILAQQGRKIVKKIVQMAKKSVVIQFA